MTRSPDGPSMTDASLVVGSGRLGYSRYAELPGVVPVPQPEQCLGLDLPDALATDAEPAPSSARVCGSAPARPKRSSMTSRSWCRSSERTRSSSCVCMTSPAAAKGSAALPSSTQSLSWVVPSSPIGVSRLIGSGLMWRVHAPSVATCPSRRRSLRVLVLGPVRDSRQPARVAERSSCRRRAPDANRAPGLRGPW